MRTSKDQSGATDWSRLTRRSSNSAGVPGPHPHEHVARHAVTPAGRLVQCPCGRARSSAGRRTRRLPGTPRRPRRCAWGAPRSPGPRRRVRRLTAPAGRRRRRRSRASVLVDDHGVVGLPRVLGREPSAPADAKAQQIGVGVGHLVGAELQAATVHRVRADHAAVTRTGAGPPRRRPRLPGSRGRRAAAAEGLQPRVGGGRRRATRRPTRSRARGRRRRCRLVRPARAGLASDGSPSR